MDVRRKVGWVVVVSSVAAAASAFVDSPILADVALIIICSCNMYISYKIEKVWK